MKTIKIFLKITGNILFMIVLSVILILLIAKISNTLNIENTITNIKKDQIWVGDKKFDTVKILDVSDGYSRVKIKNDTLVLKNEMIKYKRNLIK